MNDSMALNAIEFFCNSVSEEIYQKCRSHRQLMEHANEATKESLTQLCERGDGTIEGLKIVADFCKTIRGGYGH